MYTEPAGACILRTAQGENRIYKQYREILFNILCRPHLFTKARGRGTAGSGLSAGGHYKHKK